MKLMLMHHYHLTACSSSRDGNLRSSQKGRSVEDLGYQRRGAIHGTFLGLAADSPDSGLSDLKHKVKNLRGAAILPCSFHPFHVPPQGIWLLIPGPGSRKLNGVKFRKT